MSFLKITGIQSMLHWENKSSNLQMLQDKIDGIRERTEIVVLPEMFSTGFSMKPEELAESMDGETVQWMKEIAIRKKIILTGSVIISQTGPGGQISYFNRLIWMLPNGEYGYYDKRHLFAFAEEDKFYTAGSKRVIASAKGWKINLLVCYDLRFPVWTRQALSSALVSEEGERIPDPEYDVLIYVANWPERRIEAWKTLLRARAIENQCYVVGVNRVGDDGNNIHYSGDSMVVDPAGEILYQAREAEDVFTVTLDRDHLNAIRKKFPFWKDADEFVITSSGLKRKE